MAAPDNKALVGELKELLQTDAGKAKLQEIIKHLQEAAKDPAVQERIAAAKEKLSHADPEKVKEGIAHFQEELAKPENKEKVEALKAAIGAKLQGAVDSLKAAQPAAK